MRLFRHPRWQHLDYRVKVAIFTQENKPPTQGTRQWTFTTPRWRCGSILLPSLNAGVPEPTGGRSEWGSSRQSAVRSWDNAWGPTGLSIICENYIGSYCWDMELSCRTCNLDISAHRSITPKFLTPTALLCIDNNWRSTTLSPPKKLISSTANLEWCHVHFIRDSYSTFIRQVRQVIGPSKNSME